MSRNRSFVAAAVAALLAMSTLTAFAAPATQAAPAKPAAQSGAPATGASTPASAAKAMKHASTSKTAMKLVDLNTASREDLIACPGIGEAIADKIIAARPFKSKMDLVSKGIVTKSAYRKLAGHVIAKQG